MTAKPIAVCISDIHFNAVTVPLASKALQAALLKAEELNIPLIVAGDLNDTKAIIRAEVANAIISILKLTKIKVYILEGNHDKVNEKSSEHGLNYLRPYAQIIDTPTNDGYFRFIPYQNDSAKLKEIISNTPAGKILIMHQGFLGAAMGDYIQDKTSIDPNVVKEYKVISGHYHKHQTVGSVTYIGSPYTITFGEANDGPKGFLILNQDGTFTREILNLRKHVILNGIATAEGVDFHADIKEPFNSSDLIWVKVKGAANHIRNVRKRDFKNFLRTENFRLDLIPVEVTKQTINVESFTDLDIFDTIIDRLEESDTHKTYMKGLYRDLITCES